MNSAEQSHSRNDSHVETLRGLACVLVVAYHVTNTNGTHGIAVTANDPLLVLNTHLSPVRLPLFTFISGYVYAMRPATAGRQLQFLFGKFRRLLLPLLAVGGLFLLVQDAIEETHHSLPLREAWRMLFFPYAHFWYLQALTVIFITIVIFEISRLMETPGAWIATLAASVVLRLLLEFPVNFFSINGALTLMPFFILGIGVRRFPELFRNRTISVAAGLTALAGIAVYHLVIINALSLSGAYVTMLQLAIGITACIALFSVKFKWEPLALIGGFSYSIYLFHIFGTAGARIILEKAGVKDTIVLIVAALCAGLILPIVVEIIADRYGLTRLLLLGRNPHFSPHPNRPMPPPFRPIPHDIQ